MIEPGVYLNMDNDEYHQSEGVSKSALMLYDKSPQRYHWQYVLGNRQDRDKKHLIVGSAIHTSTLEPEKFDDLYVLGPDVNKNTKVWKEFVGNESRDVLDVATWDMVNAMGDAVRRHPVARNILGADGIAESSIYAEDPETGLLLKCRPDWMIPSHGVIADLKSTADASQEAFFRSLYSYTYFVQSPYYLDIVKYLCMHDGSLAISGISEFMLIAVEKEPPYPVAVYRASDSDNHSGRLRYRRTLSRLAKSIRDDRWPEYNDGMIVDTAIPGWAKKAEEAADIYDGSMAF